MDDLISRQAAIKELEYANWGKDWDEALARAILESMPTIDPVKHGKWEMKPDPYGFFEEIPVCSECGCTTKMRQKYRYCPNCGARMEEK